jgi:4-alpha-glucanotransferase
MHLKDENYQQWLNVQELQLRFWLDDILKIDHLLGFLFDIFMYHILSS